MRASRGVAQVRGGHAEEIQEILLHMSLSSQREAFVRRASVHLHHKRHWKLCKLERDQALQTL
jgi:hypothetical protein